jgi:hypothetical protein
MHVENKWEKQVNQVKRFQRIQPDPISSFENLDIQEEIYLPITPFQQMVLALGEKLDYVRVELL